MEVLRGHRGHFNIIHHATGFKADMYIAGRDPLHRWALQHTRSLVLGATTLRVAPPEYVIVRKLEYFREGQSHKHVGDIARMLEQLGTKLDRVALEEMIAERGLADTWAVVLASK